MPGTSLKDRPASSEASAGKRASTPTSPGIAPSSGTPKRRKYERPRLTRHGDLRGLTFGGSPGGGDSGSIGSEFPPGFGGF